MNAKLTAYADKIREGTLTDKQIARIAGVSEADVKAARVELGKPEKPAAGAPAVAPDAAPIEGADVAPEAPPAPVEAAVAPAPVVVEEPVPSHVRAIVTRDLLGPDRKRFHLGFRAIYKGERAVWLWREHRSLVEPYPPKG